MSKSKRQVKRRMGTKKRRVVRRKTQKRKQTKRRGGEFFKRSPLQTQITYKSLGVAADPTLLGTEIVSSETQQKSSNPFSRPSTQLPDPETTIVGIESMSLDEINKMIENIQRNPETEVLKNKLKQLQDRKMKIETSPSVSFETKKRPGSFGLPFFKR